MPIAHTMPADPNRAAHPKQRHMLPQTAACVVQLRQTCTLQPRHLHYSHQETPKKSRRHTELQSGLHCQADCRNKASTQPAKLRVWSCSMSFPCYSCGPGMRSNQEIRQHNTSAAATLRYSVSCIMQCPCSSHKHEAPIYRPSLSTHRTCSAR